ncbi:uncharacterized protein LOC112580837 [Bubalus bubalis]|uniref:uncharacterized protein LOC112580837 n=1 Tax=Bubalus bubalis TaxID=89462 RepID=UPI000DBC6632|nr:uncharacterized protein LOC112580837 [Bubalus bubalis]
MGHTKWAKDEPCTDITTGWSECFRRAPEAYENILQLLFLPNDEPQGQMLSRCGRGRGPGAAATAGLFGEQGKGSGCGSWRPGEPKSNSRAGGRAVAGAAPLGVLRGGCGQAEEESRRSCGPAGVNPGVVVGSGYFPLKRRGKEESGPGGQCLWLVRLVLRGRRLAAGQGRAPGSRSLQVHPSHLATSPRWLPACPSALGGAPRRPVTGYQTLLRPFRHPPASEPHSTHPVSGSALGNLDRACFHSAQ